MRILLVSQSILPYKGGSSIIVENLAKNFTRDEMIILGSKRLNHKSYPRNPDMPKFLYYFSELSIFGRGARFFDWFRKLRMKSLKNFISKIIAKENIDHVIGVYPNSYYCLAACQAARTAGIPFSSYFHNTYLENSALNEANAEAIQEEIFEYSEYVFVMSKGMQSFYESKYDIKNFIPLVHTFNEAIQEEDLTGLPGINKSIYKLVAIGNFNESNIEATKRFVNAIADDPKFALSIYTHVPKVLLKSRGIDPDLIDYKGFIDPDDLIEELQKYDICVLTHGFHGGYGEVEYKTIFPTRTIPLLLARKPILAHSPSHSFLNDFIKENGFAELVEIADEKAILEGLYKIVENEDYQKDLVIASEITTKLFYGPKVAQFLKTKLASISK